MTKEAFLGWLRAAKNVKGRHVPKSEASVKKLFCSDGEKNWCKQMKAAGRCIKR